MIRIITLLCLLASMSICAMQLEILQSSCSFCSEPLENQETITLSCRHQIHKACYSSTHDCLKCAQEFTDEELNEEPLYSSHYQKPCCTRNCCLYHSKIAIGIVLGLGAIGAFLWLIILGSTDKQKKTS